MKKKRTVTLLAAAGLTAVLAVGVLYTVLTGTEPKSRQETPSMATQTENSGQDSAGMTDIPETFSDEAGKTIITLQQDGTTVSGDGVTVTGNTVSIQQGGTYHLSGKLGEGQIFVEAGSDETVVLLFAGVDIANSSEAAVHIENAGNTFIILEEGSENRLQSGETTDLNVGDVKINNTAKSAALYARDDLTVSGSGVLRVFGYVNNGIHTTNNLRLGGGTIFVEALNNGIKGKDSITVTDGTFSIVSGGDGLKSGDTTGKGYGMITITGGSFFIESGGDGVQAETVLDISGGDFTITSGGGSSNGTYPSDNSTKGLKSGNGMNLSGGVFSIDSHDDGIHSNGDITISGGNYQISAGDDGIHADAELSIEDGNVMISRAYEGLEGNQVHLLGGEISIVSLDDGINAYRGGSAPNLHIAGGTISINAEGDGIDSNKIISIEGGNITIDGSAIVWDDAIDFSFENGGSCTVNGGTILAIGGSSMISSFSEKSGQYCFRHNFDTAFATGDEITITDRQGNVLCSHTSAKGGSSVAFSCPELVGGETYILRAGSQSVEITLNAMSTVSGRRPEWGW